MSIREAVAQGVVRLREAGFAANAAAIDADVLVRHLLGWDRATLLLRRDEPMPADVGATFGRFIARRVEREPVAYLISSREFYGRDFAVSPAVLIPRPETELIVDAVLRECAPDAAWRIADVGTGSGILAVTIACERSEVAVVATDVSIAALQVARRNARTHRVDDRIAFVTGDLLSPAAGPFDVIVSNPPYVAARDAAGLAPDVREFEPGLALFGGEAGLDIVQRLLVEAAARLTPAGTFVMEFGAGQQYDVAHHATRAGFEVLEVAHDLQQIPRAIICRLRADR